jgi:NADPH:quinone reductase-like Zn-dependent oxidoreductase
LSAGPVARRDTRVRLLAEGALTVSVDERFPLARAAQALARARHGAHGTAIVLRPGDPG